MSRFSSGTARFTMVLSIAVMVSTAGGPAAASASEHETLPDRHHRLLGTVAAAALDARSGGGDAVSPCLSCHAIDTRFGLEQFLIERECRACHHPDDHHRLYSAEIPYPTDAPYGTPGELYVCFSCHAIDSSSGMDRFPVERDCRTCHHTTGIQTVVVDIRPGSPRNPFNPRSRGVLPVSILGSDDYDVREIDVSSLLLEGQVPPVRASFQKGPDGYENLKLAFSSEAVRSALGYLRRGHTYDVWINGFFEDGTQVLGRDSIIVVPASWRRWPRAPRKPTIRPERRENRLRLLPQPARRPADAGRRRSWP